MQTQRTKKYTFYYKYAKKDKDKKVIIEASSDRDAVFKLLDKTGVCMFGCIKANGEIFSDREYMDLIERFYKGC